MTPAAYVKSVLVTELNQIPEISVEHVHAFFIPKNETSTDEAIIVISDLPEYGTDYGNDSPYQAIKQVQVQFYYPPDYEADMDVIENEVKQQLLANRIRCFSDAGHIYSPDTKNITNTLKFRFTKEAI